MWIWLRADFLVQDFSISGKRNGFGLFKNHKGELIDKEDGTEETRGQLYLWMKQVIEITKPKIFIAENVKSSLVPHYAFFLVFP